MRFVIRAVRAALFSRFSSSSSQPDLSNVPVSLGVSIKPEASFAGQPFKKTFYKRQLPTTCIAFASPEGRTLFAEALSDGTMSGFFTLMQQFSMQDEPAFCGLTSLTMVLNALAIDPRRIWKGGWRWFHEAMLDCCRPLDQVKKEGITLPQAACLARCNGAKVEMMRYGDFTEEEFRNLVIRVCQSGEEHIIASYSRKTLQQTGDGHFSPVGGYNRANDLVLVLDVARFKYPPHWVPLPLLHEAMSHLDPSTGLPRGYLHLSSHPLLDSAMFTLDIRPDGWEAARDFVQTMPSLLADIPQDTKSPKAVIEHLIKSLPTNSLKSFLVVRDSAQQSSAQHSASSIDSSVVEKCVPTRMRDLLLAEIRGLPLYHAVSESLTSIGNEINEEFWLERVTIFLLLQPPGAWPQGEEFWGSSSNASEWMSLLDLSPHTVMSTEISYIRQQLLHIDEVIDSGLKASQCQSHSHVLDCKAHGH